MKPIIALILVAACADQPSYLGATLPKSCAGGDAERCIGWMAERDLSAAELDTYNDPGLTAYVQGIVGKLAKGSQLTAAPAIQIANHEASYATLGGRIVIGRPTIQRLGSEAELAAVLAHELAHLEGHHADASLGPARTDAAWLERRRDAEAIADERAILLVERAGYATGALASALDRVLEGDDDEHPPRAKRIARARALATAGGFEGRAELAQHLAHTVLGRDSRLGVRVGDAWVVAALGVALVLAPDDVVATDEDVLTVRRGGTTLTAYAIGEPWARELKGTLASRKDAASELGDVTTGIVPATATTGDETPIGKVEHALRSSLPQPGAGTQVAILDRGRAALLVEVAGRAIIRLEPPRALPTLHLRPASEAELAAAQPPRLVLERAQLPGPAGTVVACGTRLVERADRQVAAGELIRCADRRVASAAETPRAE